MTKTYLLAAAAAAAMVAAGSAQAGSLSARAGASGPFTQASPYLLASELNFGSGVPSTVGQFDTVFTFNTALTPGSYTVTLALTGATITSPLSSTPASTTTAAITVGNKTGAFGFEAAPGDATIGQSSTLTVTSQTANQVVFSLFVPAGNSVNAIYIAPAMLVTGNYDVTAAATNQITGQAVDPSVLSRLIATGTRGFAQAISGSISGGLFANNDTRIAEGTSGAGRFSTLSGDNVAGAVILGVYGDAQYDAIFGTSTTGLSVFKDLNGTPVALTDVQSQTVSVTGNIPQLQFSTGATVYNGTGTNTQTATLTGGASFTTVNVAPASAAAVGRPQIAPTSLAATASYTLNSGFAAQAAGSGSLENLQTDGFTYIIPWVASQTLSGTSGNQTVIRVSNIAGDLTTAGGNVYVQVYNPSTGNAAVAAGRSVLVGAIGTSGELVLTSQSLEALLGNFGRADLRLTVTTSATTINTLPGGVGTLVGSATTTTPGQSNIVVKRLIATANGGLTEVSIMAGEGSSTANLPENQATGY